MCYQASKFCATIYIEIEKVDVFRKVLNKQFIERLRAIFIINKTQLQTPTDCFTPWGDHQGDLIQIELFIIYIQIEFYLNKVPLMIPPRVETVCGGL